MKYIKEYSIFESNNNELYYADISTLNDYIHSMCDNLDILYINSIASLKVPNGYNGIFFINNTINRFCFFFNKEYYVENVTKINESIAWFKNQINGIPMRDGNTVVRYQSSQYLTAKNIRLEIVDYSDDHMLIKSEIDSYKTEIVSDIIRAYSSYKSDDSDRLKLKNEIKSIDKNFFIKSFYQSYVNRGFDYNYEMFSAYKNEKDKVVDIIKSTQIKMPYNLDKQFIYDAFPTFFEKIYMNSGLICRIDYSEYSESKIVDSSSRLRQRCPKEDIEDMLKKYNINMHWNEIFIRIKEWPRVPSR